MEVQVLLCRRVLDRMPEVSDETIAFVQNWLSQLDAKAVVLPQDWEAFVRRWEHDLRDSPESRGPFFAMLRGIITPYRDKYAEEAGIQDDGESVASKEEVEAMRIITNRHYATCTYLLTEDLALFRGRKLRLPDARILTPELLRAELQAVSN